MPPGARISSKDHAFLFSEIPTFLFSEIPTFSISEKPTLLFSGYMLFQEGTFQIDYYENESLNPSTTKNITVKYNSAELANQINTHETIQYDNVFYPVVHFPEWQNDYYDTNFVKQLLRTGKFHSDVIWSGAEEVKWFGLFKTETGFYLMDTKIEIQSVYEGNGCCYCDSTDSGFDVQVTNTDTCLILIPEIDFLKSHKISEADLSDYISKNMSFPDYNRVIWNWQSSYPLRTKSEYLPGTQIFPGDTIKIMYMGVDYNIYATGGRRGGGYVDEWASIFNYKLYLSANKNGQIINQLLIAQPDIREMISILFAGDIDGDGFLDLLIERTYHSEIKTLYLSIPADNGHLLKVVGELRNPVPGCC